MLEVARCPFELAKLDAQESAGAVLFEIFGFHHEHHVDDRESLVEGLRIEVDLFQVVQHARQNLPVTNPREDAIGKLEHLAILARNSFPAIIDSQDLAFAKRIDEELFGRLPQYLTMKWPGIPTPAIGKFSRRATSR